MPFACHGRYIVNDRAYPNRPFVLSQFAYTIDNALYRQVVAHIQGSESDNGAESVAQAALRTATSQKQVPSKLPVHA